MAKIWVASTQILVDVYNKAVPNRTWIVDGNWFWPFVEYVHTDYVQCRIASYMTSHTPVVAPYQPSPFHRKMKGFATTKPISRQLTFPFISFRSVSLKRRDATTHLADKERRFLFPATIQREQEQMTFPVSSIPYPSSTDRLIRSRNGKRATREEPPIAGIRGTDEQLFVYSAPLQPQIYWHVSLTYLESPTVYVRTFSPNHRKSRIPKVREGEEKRQRKAKRFEGDSNFTSFRSRSTNDSIDARHARATRVSGLSSSELWKIRARTETK